MKRYIVILFICFAAIGCKTKSDSDSKTEAEVKTLSYKVVKKENISYSNNYRIVNRVVLNVDSLPSEQRIKETAKNIMQDNFRAFLSEKSRNEHNMEFKEVTVFFYLPGMDTGSFAYAVAEFKSSILDSFKINEHALFGTKWNIKPDDEPQLTSELFEYNINILTEQITNKRIKISINTNFPDGTNLFLTVGRPHTLKGTNDKYSGSLFSDDFFVTQGKVETTITIDDSAWYNEHQRLVRVLPDDIMPINTITDSISISVLYTPARNKSPEITNILGVNGENVGGAGASPFGRMITFRVQKNLYLPFKL